MIRCGFLVGVGLALPFPGSVMAGVDEAVDAFVKGQVAKQQIPGLALAVVRDGQVVFARGYGLANVEMGVAATPDTVFELASVSKQFTASAVMLLVGDGKIKVDDPIGDHLHGLPKSWAGITIRHLLGQTSGLKDYLAVPGLSLRDDYDDAALIKLVAEDPLDFPPGTHWAYSNTNYALLGMTVARVSGRSLAVFLARADLRAVRDDVDPDQRHPGDHSPPRLRL